MSNQYGTVQERHGAWYGRYYVDKLVSGKAKHKQVQKFLARKCDRYPTAASVRPLLDAILLPINAGTIKAESSMTVNEYFHTVFVLWAVANCKKSTVRHYIAIFRYLEPFCDIALCDMTAGKGTKILLAIFEAKGLNRKSLGHCKQLLSRIFNYAIEEDILRSDAENPVHLSKIPKTATPSKKQAAYSPQQVHSIMSVLTGVAKTAVGLNFLLGLRHGEARAAKWANYRELSDSEGMLLINETMDRSTLQTCKTEESVQDMPVKDELFAILRETPRTSPFILAGPRCGRPIDLKNLASRVIRPALAAAGMAELWHGWHSARRGCSTTCFSEGGKPNQSRSLMRHTNVATTMKSYILATDPDLDAGAQIVNDAFKKVRVAAERQASGPIN